MIFRKTTLHSLMLFFITTLHGPHGKHHILLSNIILGVFAAPLHSNGHGADHIEHSLCIVETCLPSRCLAMGTHITVCMEERKYSSTIDYLDTR
jgi:hypothetical protein